MSHHLHNSSGRSPRNSRSQSHSQKARSAGPRHRVSIKVFLMASGLLISTIGLIGSGGWLAVQLILNPESVTWLNRVLPLQNRNPFKHSPQTLSKIQAALVQDGLRSGTLLPLASSSNTRGLSDDSDVLLPILSRRPHCLETASSSDSVPFSLECGHIAELRVYRPIENTPLADQFSSGSADETLWVLIERVAVSGPDESFVVAPFIPLGIASPGSARTLPLDRVQFIPGDASPAEGIWLHLVGEWMKGRHRALYGQVVYYDSERHRLSLMLQWTSPANTLPAWKPITAQTPSLVVDQTLGLEPQFDIYQLAPRGLGRPVRLREISLTQPALPHPDYERGLLLARSGLWSPALRQLQAVRQQIQDWSLEAQAQLDAIALHARVTQAQAERTWASPGQQLIANLIDGRWDSAFEILKTALETDQDVTPILADQSGQVWERIETALRVNPDQLDVQAWGALILATQQDQAAAIAWLSQYPQRDQASDRVQSVLSQLNPSPVSSRSSSSSSSSLEESVSHQIVGTASVVSAVNDADWLSLHSTQIPDLGDQQAWYRIQVEHRFAGQDGARSPFANDDLNQLSARQLIDRFGITPDTRLRLMFWADDGRSHTLSVRLQAARLQSGRVELLAVGSALTGDFLTVAESGSLFAFTSDTIRVIPLVGQSTLRDISDQHPEWASLILPRIEQILSAEELHNGSSTSQSVSSMKPDDLLNRLGSSPTQLIDLTGDAHAEAVITLRPSQLDASHSPLQTLVISHQGDVLYSGRSLGVAILGDRHSALIAQDASQTYHLRRWSDQHQQFR
ncbi:MAG: hypothetical protein ACFE0J_18225 [Elainellaceae cyanobacterium]